MRFTGWLIVAASICLIVAIAGVVLAWLQHQRLNQWVAVEATIRMIDPPQDGPFGRPTPAYRYRVGEQEYTGTQLTPLGLFEGDALRRRIESAHPEGEPVTAYHHPSDPTRSFLLHRAGIAPWMLMLPPMVAAALLWPFAMTGGLLWPRAKLALQREGGWFMARPVATLHQRRRNLLAALGVWLGYGALVMGGYMLTTSPPRDPLLGPAALGWVAAAAIPLAMLVAQQRRLHWFEDAAVGLSRQDPPAGGPVIVRYSQALRRAATVGEATVALICERREGLVSEPLFRSSAVVTRHRRIEAEGVLNFEHRFQIPTRKRRPSSPFHRWRYPRIDWLIRVDVRLVNGPNYTASFPIMLVEAEDE